MRLNTPEENRAYVDGFIAANKANGLDWARVRVLLERVRAEYKARIDKKDDEIRRLRSMLVSQREEYESKIIDLESHIEALKIAWKHRNEGV